MATTTPTPSPSPAAGGCRIEVEAYTPRAATITVTGELDMLTAPHLHNVLTNTLCGYKAVTLDLCAVRFFSSAGAHVVATAHTAASGALTIFAPTTPARTVLALCDPTTLTPAGRPTAGRPCTPLNSAIPDRSDENRSATYCCAQHPALASGTELQFLHHPIHPEDPSQAEAPWR